MDDLTAEEKQLIAAYRSGDVLVTYRGADAGEWTCEPATDGKGNLRQSQWQIMSNGKRVAIVQNARGEANANAELIVLAVKYYREKVSKPKPDLRSVALRDATSG